MVSRDARRIIICWMMMMKSVHFTFSSVCDADEYYCQNTIKCIDSDYICDNDNDCGDFSDESEELCDRGVQYATATYYAVETTETEIPSRECPYPEIPCPGQSYKQCIYESWICDGEKDCLSYGSDEINCTNEASTNKQASTVSAIVIRYRTVTVSCNDNTFQCPQFCISKNWVCDGEEDCTDGSDESPQMCLGRSDFTTGRVRYQTIPVITTIDTMRVEYPPDRKTYSMTSDEKSTDNFETQDSLSISFFSGHLVRIGFAFIILILVCVIVIATIVCRKRKSRTAGLNSRNAEDRLQAVSFLNSSVAPESQAVLVSIPVQVQPTVVQPSSPPPYDTLPNQTGV